MLKVGITGGIGSGKSTVSSLFSILGIPVFNADSAARWLTENDSTLAEGIKNLLGNDAYKNNLPDRTYIAGQVFENPEKLAALNALIHPATIAYGERWMTEQQTPYIIKEAAIFFETGSNKAMDVMIGVHAPLDIRISRTINRDATGKEQVLSRIARQMDETEKMMLCDYVITNDGVSAIIPQVLQLHTILLNRAQNPDNY